MDGLATAVGIERVRLWGIDAPERGTPDGDAATAALRALLALSPRVTCHIRHRGRAVALCLNGNARQMVTRGHAKDYPRYSEGYYR